jgi:hypothetical protein
MQRRLLSGRAIGMIAARVVVASDETVLAALRKIKDLQCLNRSKTMIQWCLLF